MNLDHKLIIPVGTTLDRFISRNQDAFPHASGELSQLLRDIALASKIVNREVSRSGLVEIFGSVDTVNIQGEGQQKLDIIANLRFIRALKNGGQVAAIVSEENEDIIDLGNINAKYIVAIDPLDGSSNIEVNVPIGTIFSIYRRVSDLGTNVKMADFLQGAKKQIAAGYILYGSSLMLVYTTGRGVNGFTYEYSLGDFFLSYPSIKSPVSSSTYSCNEGNFNDFSPDIKKYLEHCRAGGFASRYVGSLVADFHRNLLKGGIYLYPATIKRPQGKLRLLYECFPLAFILEQAHGLATNGENNIMDMIPNSIHERSSFFAGSSKLLEELASFNC